MIGIGNRYNNRLFGIFLLVILALTIQCKKAIVNTPENEVVLGKMTDIDGNEYKTIKIGNQIWTAENFRAKRYNDGEIIYQISEIRAWGLDTTGAFCFYNNTSNYDTIRMYGALYSYYAVASQKLAPTGWRVPTKDDWIELQTYLISNKYNWDETLVGNKIGKALASQTEWDTLSEPGVVGSNLLKNDAVGFCAYPSGQRIFRGTKSYSVIQEDNGFEKAGDNCNWWTASGYNSSAWFYGLGSSYERLLEMATNGLSSGFSIRLIKDEEE